MADVESAEKELESSPVSSTWVVLAVSLPFVVSDSVPESVSAVLESDVDLTGFDAVGTSLSKAAVVIAVVATSASGDSGLATCSSGVSMWRPTAAAAAVSITGIGGGSIGVIDDLAGGASACVMSCIMSSNEITGASFHCCLYASSVSSCG
jgi:hypothetical protein